MNRVQFVHEDADKYISQPILQDPIKSDLHKSRHEKPTSLQVPTDYPGVMEKILKNEQDLKELKEKLDKKIA